MKAIIEWDFTDFGIDHAQYFTGAGTAFTKWDHVEVGTGANGYEAFEEAVDGLGMMGYDVEVFENPFIELKDQDNSVELGYAHDPRCQLFLDEYAEFECVCDYSEESELYYYVAIHVRDALGFEPRKPDAVLISSDNSYENGTDTYVDRMLDIGMKNGKPFWRVEDMWNRQFIVHSPFMSDEGNVTWHGERIPETELHRFTRVLSA